MRQGGITKACMSAYFFDTDLRDLLSRVRPGRDVKHLGDLHDDAALSWQVRVERLYALLYRLIVGAVSHVVTRALHLIALPSDPRRDGYVAVRFLRIFSRLFEPVVADKDRFGIAHDDRPYGNRVGYARIAYRRYHDDMHLLHTLPSDILHSLFWHCDHSTHLLYALMKDLAI